MNKSSFRFGRALILAVAVAACPFAMGQDGAPDGEWPNYGGGPGSTKYTALDQINKSNVNDLKVMWTWNSPENERTKENRSLMSFSYEATPILIDGTMYTSSSHSDVSAVDASTGETIWTYDPGTWEKGRPTNLGFVHRGVCYWEDGGEKRIFIGTGDARLIALNAETGEPITSFGNNGEIDLTKGLRREIDPKQYAVTSPPVVCRGVVVVGSSIFDGPTHKTMPPGDVRGFDAKTGELKWTFHSIAQPGEFGHETWENGSWEYTGNANVWTLMSVDEELGHVYLPFGTPTNDWYGGHRHGAGLFGESLVAVNAETGERVWHFQHVHHGVWDYDLCAAPALMDIKVDGKETKALAQVTKQGMLWVLNRETGEGVWPIEERPVPQSTTPGEKSHPTQPFPTKPEPFQLQGVEEDHLIDFTPELKAEALEILKDYNYGPLYTPPTPEKPTIYMPGWGGGGNWYGCAFDPETSILYVPSQRSAITMTLSEPDKARSDFNYIGRTGAVRGPQGLPLWKPPYSSITAYNMTTGDKMWEVPIGDGPVDHPALKDLDNVPDRLGDSGRGFILVTKSLIFIANASRTPTLFAYDKKTGEELARVALPNSPGGALMSYELNGKQYIAIPCGGRRDPAELVVLGLPS